MSQAQGELSIICQEKQSFAGKIEPAHGMKNLPFFGQKIVNCRPARFIQARTNTADRLVQGHVKLPFGANGFAIHGNRILLRLNFGAEHPDRLAVDLNAPGQNDLFAGTARSHACFCQKLLQTNHKK